MKKKITLYVLVLIVALSATNKTYATHVLGGELLYTYMSGTTYKVSLTVYGDCSGQSFPSLNNAAPSIEIYYNSNIFLTQISLTQEGPGVEVSQVCPSQLPFTKCKNTANLLPGVTKYVYSKTINIGVTSSLIRFIFNGTMGSGPNPSSAGRSNAITNIIMSGGSSLMFLEATLNNTDGPNSSPQYTSIPTPYFCVNKPQQYNQGAADPDNDSLSFSLTPALENGSSVYYKSPYTATEPLATAAGSFKYNSINGQMEFLPDQSQTSLVANKVEEYKNGILVGSSMREMNVIVLNNCSNNPPNSSLNNDIAGARNSGSNVMYACHSEPFVSFSISAYDADSNIVAVAATSKPAGSTVVITDNNTSHPAVSFSWDITSVPDGIYNLYVNYVDDACPISSSQTVAYTIVVVSTFTAKHTVLFPTRCYNKQFTRIQIDGGTVPKNINIVYNNTVTLKSFVDSSKITVIEDSFSVGNYTVNVSSPIIPCELKYNFTVIDSGSYPLLPNYDNINLCVGDALLPIQLTTKDNTPVSWYDAEGNKLAGPPTYNTETANVFHYFVTQQIGACESIADTFKITVHKLPEVEIINKPSTICMGDKLALEATGADYYNWQPATKVFRDDIDGKIYSKITEATTYKVIGSTFYGCKDSTDITYSNIEQCCTFSYPNAFTPNGDGRNDGFRVILYGNETDYHLWIYNRWGQEVFSTNDPKKYWDGYFNYKPCDIGVYYYRVKGKCLTGHVEEQAGEFTLIR